MQQLLGMAREKHTKVKESELNKMVAIVTPEIGLLDDPTTPAI